MRAIQAFIAKDGRQIDAIVYYNTISHPLHIVKAVLYVTQTTLGDAVVVRSLHVYACSAVDGQLWKFQIWRCYAILDQRLLVLIPYVVLLSVNAGGMTHCWTIHFNCQVNKTTRCRMLSSMVVMGNTFGDNYLPLSLPMDYDILHAHHVHQHNVHQ